MTLRDLVFQAKKQKRSTTAIAVGYTVHTCVYAFMNDSLEAKEPGMERCQERKKELEKWKELKGRNCKNK
jgi:hypothetical protein